jgi:Family of unknown function (DUF5335)
MNDRSIKKEDWSAYFENLSEMLTGKRILIEIASPSIGDQIEAHWVPLAGVTYDPKDDLIDVAVEHLNHIIRKPQSVYIHHDDKHLAAIEVRGSGGEQHILKFKEPFSFGGGDR